MAEFQKHLEIIKDNEIKFVNPTNFEEELKNNKKQRKLLLTIDDGYKSFYDKAWPIFKKFQNSIYTLCEHERSRKTRLYELERN